MSAITAASNIDSLSKLQNSDLSGNSIGTKSQRDMDSLVSTREDFLTILLAQLKHQDPLDPMKGTEFIDSITRLSDVEQSINQNTHLEKIESLLKSQGNNFGSPVSYLDQEVEFKSDTVHLVNGQATFSYNLGENPDQVFITVTDSKGNIVKNAAGSSDLGKNKIVWDGKDTSGNPLPDGDYKVSVSYPSGSEEDATIKHASTTTTGIVTGANFEGSDVVLMVGNIQTTLGDILSIRSTKSPVSSYAGNN